MVRWRFTEEETAALEAIAKRQFKSLPLPDVAARWILSAALANWKHFEKIVAPMVRYAHSEQVCQYALMNRLIAAGPWRRSRARKKTK
jgi:hypothetical protein